MKNYLEVNGVTRNTQGDITHIGYFVQYNNGSKKTKYAITVALGVWMIENNYELLSVVGIEKQKIGVVNSNPKYLRTYKDNEWNNNLDHLPNLPEVN